MPNVLSVQSSVAYGHVGNSAAVFPLQRLGIEVWPVHTVQFSNHTGYGAWRGEIFDADHVRDVIEGMAERGAIGRCDAVVSGYLGDAQLGEVVLNTVRRVRAEVPRAVYACDPVIGDQDRGVFVRQGIPEFFRNAAMAVADVVTPNQFELAWLTGKTVTDPASLIDAAQTLRRMGPKTVIVTSVEVAVADDELGVLGVDDSGAWLVKHSKLPVSLNGTGDVMTALMLAERLVQCPLAEGLARGVGRMFALVEATHKAGSRELHLVQNDQAWLVRPPALAVEALS